jgi:hypothetical protein
MDLITLLTSVTSAVGITLGAARWLTQRAVDHRLNRDLASFKSDLDQQLIQVKAALDTDLTEKKASLDAKASEAKVMLEATLRRQVEDYLGDRSAERQYRLEARKHLYTAIGPLRFQLIIAAAEFANRVANIGTGKQDYSLAMTGYFGRSTGFRLLRLYALAELIERQIAHADFSVDAGTVSLLRFKTTSFKCLSSGSVSLKHPAEDWSNQVQHVFYDTLSTIASAMIVGDPPAQRVMRFDEFSAFVVDADKRKRLSPIPRLLDGLSPTNKPLLWLRFVALAHVCTRFASREGFAIGVTPDPLDTRALLEAAGDDFINANLQKYLSAFDEMSQHVVALEQAKVAAG